MPSSVKKPPPNPELSLVAMLARHLLSASPQFEDVTASARSSSQIGMRCLAALDTPTRLSLETKKPEPAPPETPAPVVAQAAPTAPAYGTRRPEYRQGLEDRSVIEALLSYHRRKRPPSASRAPSNEFRPNRPTPVAAIPKPEPRLAAQRPGATRVFRSRGE
jgi:hypothetical protein